MTPDAVVVDAAAAACGVMLLAAAASKVEGLTGWTALIKRFPISLQLRRAFWIGVPAAEAAIAILVFVRPAAGFAATAALLLVFAAVLARYMRVLKGADCHCFGNLAASTIGWSLVARNAGLATVATGAAVVASTTAGGAVPPSYVAVCLLGGVVVSILVEYRKLPKNDRLAEMTSAGGGESGG